MNSKYTINENQKSNKKENKIRILIKNPNSSGRLYISKNMKISNILKQKIKFLNNNKKILPKEKSLASYQKRSNLPIININNIESCKKKLSTIKSFNTYETLKDTDLKEKVIVELDSQQNDIDAQNQQLNNLQSLYSKLQDNNLTYKIVMEKILDLEEKEKEKEKEINDNNINNNIIIQCQQQKKKEEKNHQWKRKYIY